MRCLTESLDKITYPDTKWSTYAIGCRMMLVPRQKKRESLTPVARAERWIARLAVRAVVEIRKHENVTSSAVARHPKEGTNAPEDDCGA